MAFSFSVCVVCLLEKRNRKNQSPKNVPKIFSFFQIIKNFIQSNSNLFVLKAVLISHFTFLNTTSLSDLLDSKILQTLKNPSILFSNCNTESIHLPLAKLVEYKRDNDGGSDFNPIAKGTI